MVNWTKILLMSTCATTLMACGQNDGTATQAVEKAQEQNNVPHNAQAKLEAAKNIIAHNPLRNAYFGDLHIHTKNSYDAYLFSVRSTPDEAYEFAKGGKIKHPMGYDMQLNSGPLDFLAVADHAEYLGVIEAMMTPGTEYSKVSYANEMNPSDRLGIFKAFGYFVESLLTGEIIPELSSMDAPRSAWQETIDSAERHNNPGTFTTFIAYEFTSLPDVRNLHRNVIFADNNVPALPYSALDSQNPEDLWRWLDRQRAEGNDALAIPHNANGSDGTMFERTMWNGKPIDANYAKLRSRNEPLIEISQIKGQSETMPLLSPNDEFAGFELMTSYIGAVKPITKFEGGYARHALKRGLEIEEGVGENPYNFGFISSSDGHVSAGPFEEDNYFAKVGVLDGIPERRGSVYPEKYKSWDEYYVDREKPPLSSTWGSAGLSGVWAESNTRASLFAAMRRKETFGTTGPRMRVRMFSGYNLPEIDLATNAGVKAAYANATPMGGNLIRQEGKTPEFVVIASRDVNSAPLQRLQIIKGWVDASGQSHEKIYDIACSDNGMVKFDNNRCEDNGASVNLNTCEFSKDKGDAELQARWKDPAFDPAQNAFYYVRVLENPTCRWSTWDAIRANIEPNPKLATTIQERAYTSPIWLIANHDG